MKRVQMLSVRFWRVVVTGAKDFRIMLCLLIVATGTTTIAQTITAMYDFGSKSGDPLDPQLVGAIAQGRDGNMWSTAPKGGKNGIGAAFKITPGGKLTDIHDFNPSAKPIPEGTPYSGLTLGTDGNFYGTMVDGGNSTNCSGGCGAIFKMTPSGAVTILYSFTGGNDGKVPYAPPIEATDGSLWGTTVEGGSQGFGTVYQWTPKGGLTTWVQFNETDGAYPIGPLVQGTDGSFYGTTSQGNNNCGNDNICATVFKVTSSGNFTQLYSFPFTNDGLADGLVQGNDGNFYGTIPNDGAHGDGYVFKITPKGVLTDIYDFTGGNDGANPYAGLVLATDGNFYGVTANGGSLGFGAFFGVSPKGKLLETASFDGTNGEHPTVTLIQLTNGTLYGDAPQGGATTDTGTFYKVTGLKFEKTPFVSLLPASGKVGATIEILGQGLTGTTAVSFNGSGATFKVVSATYMTATVPGKATTGFVTVTTPKGTLKSNRKFQVLK